LTITLDSVGGKCVLSSSHTTLYSPQIIIFLTVRRVEVNHIVFSIDDSWLILRVPLDYGSQEWTFWRNDKKSNCYYQKKRSDQKKSYVQLTIKTFQTKPYSAVSNQKSHIWLNLIFSLEYFNRQFVMFSEG